MTFYKIISRRPNCNHCGKPMESWNPFGDFHEHPECSADRTSDKLMEIIKQQFEAMKGAQTIIQKIQTAHDKMILSDHGTPHLFLNMNDTSVLLEILLKEEKVKHLYELTTGDSCEKIFLIAESDQEAIKMACEKTEDEGEEYEFEEDDILMKIRVHEDEEKGIKEYINYRELYH